MYNVKLIHSFHCFEFIELTLTYVETEEGVCYLSLITDAYSHMIVGWAVGPTLETVYPLEALRMALSTIDDETAAMLIHHSNRGSLYCSQTYVQELKRYNISISMTQSGDPLENAVAERANGILKTEWLYKMTIPTREACKQELERIINYTFYPGNELFFADNY